jgi:hypothetical protein
LPRGLLAGLAQFLEEVLVLEKHDGSIQRVRRGLLVDARFVVIAVRAGSWEATLGRYYQRGNWLSCGLVFYALPHGA